MPGAVSPGMIGHHVTRARQAQREEALGDFLTFCAGQTTRIRRQLQTEPLPPMPLQLGECFRPMLPPESFTLTVR
jgi:hypothetical protein